MSRSSSAKSDKTKTPSLLRRLVGTKQAAPTIVEDAQKRTVLVTVINPFRKVIGELFQTLSSRDPEKYTNATLLQVNSNSEQLPPIDSYANTHWQNCPILIFRGDALFFEYSPRNFLTDKHQWGQSSVQAERESLARYAKSQGVRTSSLRPTMPSAIEKNHELKDRLQKIQAKESLEEETDYLDINGNQIRDKKTVYEEDGKLNHNETHINPNFTDVEAVAVTRENFDLLSNDDSTSDPKKTVMSGAVSVLSALYLKEQIENERQNIISQRRTILFIELEERKFNFLVSDLGYFKRKRVEYQKQSAQIQEIKDEDFDIAKLPNSDLKDALLRKKTKFNNFATTAKHAKTNALLWLEKNIEKNNSYIRHSVETIERMPCSKDANGNYKFNAKIAEDLVRKRLNAPLTLDIYDSKTSKMESLDEKQIAKLKKKILSDLKEKAKEGSDDFLYELFVAQTPAAVIDEILVDFKLSDKSMARKISYTKAAAHPSFNILYLALNSNNDDLVTLALDLIEKYSPKYLDELPEHLINIANNVGFNYSTIVLLIERIKSKGDKYPKEAISKFFEVIIQSYKNNNLIDSVENLSSILKLANIHGYYNKNLLISAVTKINEIYNQNKSQASVYAQPAVRRMIELADVNDRTWLVNFFASRNLAEPSILKQYTKSPEDKYVDFLRQQNIQTIIFDRSLLSKKLGDDNPVNLNEFLQKIRDAGIKIKILVPEKGNPKDFLKVIKDPSELQTYSEQVGLDNSIADLCEEEPNAQKLFLGKDDAQINFSGLRQYYQTLTTNLFQESLSKDFLDDNRIKVAFPQIIHNTKCRNILIDLDVADMNLVKTFLVTNLSIEESQRPKVKLISRFPYNVSAALNICRSLEYPTSQLTLTSLQPGEKIIDHLNRYFAAKPEGVSTDIFCSKKIFDKINPGNSSIKYAEETFYQWSFDSYLEKESATPVVHVTKAPIRATMQITPGTQVEVRGSKTAQQLILSGNTIGSSQTTV